MQNILITGGNAGIGKATALALAKGGDRIIIAGRNNNKINTAVNEIKAATGNNEIHPLHCDLASFDSIKKCTKTFKNQFDSLDILINNAGIATDKLQFTKEGFELQIGVNHLGHFLLTMELLNHLSISDQPRIINVSSNAHFRGKINFDSFKGEIGFKGIAGYSQSKLANVLFTNELARRYPKIISHSLHPGGVRTDIAKKNDNSLLWKTVWTIATPFLITIEKGAKTPIYLAQSDEPLKVNGRYFYKQKEINPSKLATDKVLAKKLWEVSEKLVASTS